MTTDSLRIGACYSNGTFGKNWVVRQVIAIGDCEDPRPAPCVHYKVLVGEHRRKRFTAPLQEFLEWVKYEVVRQENEWERIAV
jgi:CBS domain-containing membrane protein